MSQKAGSEKLRCRSVTATRAPFFMRNGLALRSARKGGKWWFPAY
jgi:hypothetical protein